MASLELWGKWKWKWVGREARSIPWRRRLLERHIASTFADPFCGKMFLLMIDARHISNHNQSNEVYMYLTTQQFLLVTVLPGLRIYPYFADI